MSTQTHHLPAGQKLTVVSTAPTTGSVWQNLPSLGSPVDVTSGGSVGFGPYTTARSFAVDSVNGELAVTIAATDDKPLPCNPTTIAANRRETIPADHQLVVFGTLTVSGHLTVNGTLRVAALPALT